MNISPSQAEAALAQLPQCAQAAASQGIKSSGCGFDVACLCTNGEFLLLLQNTLAQTCDADAQKTTLAAAATLCTTAVPSLKDSLQAEIIASLVVMMILAALAVFLRLVSRKISAAKFGIDDALIIVALLFSWALSIDGFLAVHYGFGLHEITLSQDDIVNYAKADWASQIIFAAAITTTKLSLLFFYHRIFPVRKFTTILIITGIVMIGWCIALICSVIFGCKPVNYFWNKTIQGGHCINENVLSYGITAANIATDVIVLVLPIPWLWNLQMRTAKKLALSGIFLLGSFVCIAGIVRIPLLLQLRLYDVTWTITKAGIWINVECNIGVVSACLPVMWPLIKRIPSLPKSVSSRLTALFSSRHSKASRLNKSKSTDRTVVDHDDDDDATNPNDKTNEVDATSWQRPSDRSAKHLTYRSEAEGYGIGSLDDIELLGAEEEHKTDKNDSSWIDETGREQLLYPSQYPAALLKG
ncbi:hypothetical protein N7G274_010549 [Stereocaulon virgatum]|uniref:CFEM domain-containing protein n=1 Tax=Stereocaulon virgatum TaxID=373712 RepID=A0ABR3ZVC0_9LECA